MSHAHEFGAAGDGTTDDTNALEHLIQRGDGLLQLPRGTYRLTRTLTIDTAKSGRIGIDGSAGTATLLMAAPGPALRIVGHHAGSADPGSFKPATWSRERLPTIRNLEVVGAHPEADGVELVGTMQATLDGLAARECRTAVRITGRNRNVLITNCQLYHNRAVGIHLDAVNLHQINITANHVSYNRLGGIRIERSEIRNLQITGNDIEYNNFRSHSGADPAEPTAEIYIDSRGGASDSPRPSVREVTIASNTIQATYSPGGANVRILGPEPTGELPPGMLAITGNVIGNQAINVHLVHCRGVALAGNFIYCGFDHNLLAEDCDHLAIGANSVGHNAWRPNMEVQNNLRLVRCTDCTLTGLDLRGTPSGTTTWPITGQPPTPHDALLELVDCHRITATGCALRDPAPAGVLIDRSSAVLLSACQVHDTRTPPLMAHALIARGPGQLNRLLACTLTGSTDAPVHAADDAGLTQSDVVTG